ncbi:DUF485 domain-containing protein [Pseudomonas sp. NA-150]|uniref:DUF485 domain-containing protein n=1 Tax=Pseudomonas sp. NA-150 TaxID=3367525 RepID=UPI0037C9708C
MIIDLALSSVDSETNKTEAMQDFNKAMVAKNRMLLILSSVFCAYYFALIIGAGWFRSLFIMQLPGGLNVGIAFALSQYFFVAGLAVIYAWRMQRVDLQIKKLAQTWRLNNETC